MTTKHTPGPWQLAGQTTISDANKDFIVANVGSYSISTEEAEANARLIAAAPELLAFANLVSRMTTDEELGGDMSGDDAVVVLSEIIEQARAASAKATGEQT